TPCRAHGVSLSFDSPRPSAFATSAHPWRRRALGEFPACVPSCAPLVFSGLCVSARIIDGKAIAETIHAELRARVAERVAQGRRVPGLAVVMVGDDPASQSYVRNKRRACVAVGMKSFSHDLPATTSEAELLALIDRLNADPEVDGILVQLPLPEHID